MQIMLRKVFENSSIDIKQLDFYDREGGIFRNSAADPVFMDVDTVIRLHDMVGAGVLKEPGLLESAVAKVKWATEHGETSPFRMAAILGRGIVQNHPFTDGNKRTALLAMKAFLALNGKSVPVDGTGLSAVVIGFADKSLDDDTVAALMIVSLPSSQFESADMLSSRF